MNSNHSLIENDYANIFYNYIKKSFENNSNINYFDLIILDIDENKDSNIINIDWTKCKFDKLILALVHKEHKFFKKHYDIYKYQNLEYHIADEHDKSMVFVENLIDNYKYKKAIYHGYVKHNVPTHMFPSTKNIHDKFSVTKYTVKINNRIYLNFEIKKNLVGTSTSYNVNINYNHNNNVDLNNNLMQIKEIMNTLQKILYEK